MTRASRPRSLFRIRFEAFVGVAVQTVEARTGTRLDAIGNADQVLGFAKKAMLGTKKPRDFRLGVW